MLFIFSKKKGVLKTLEILSKDKNPVCFETKEELLEHAGEASLIVIDEEKELLPSLLGKPILFLGSDFPEEEAAAFLQKPFSAEMFLKKIALLENLAETKKALKFKSGLYFFDASARILKKGEDEFRLTEKEGQLIQYLYEHKGQSVSKETLLSEIFGYHEAAETHTVETHIYKLRQKIKDDDGSFIQTTEGGYTLSNV